MYSQGVGTARPFCRDTYQTVKKKKKDTSSMWVKTSQKSTFQPRWNFKYDTDVRIAAARERGSHQRRCGGCGVQEGREVVSVRVLVLVVVLMELEGQGRRHALLVLRRAARRARRGARCRWTAGSGASRSRCVVFGPWDAASALALL